MRDLFLSESETKKWKINGFQQIIINSKLDNKKQKAWFYKSSSKVNKPLVVSLHSWSGSFNQFDSIAFLSKNENWNYIHPDFRGQNDDTCACCSKFVIADIEDAIDFALKNSNVDKEYIYIVGMSGGGLAALCMYMKSNVKIRTYSVWCPITNLITWYYESKTRENKYFNDILKCTGSNNILLDTTAAKLRSPIFMPIPIEKSHKERLTIYAGVFDGITGSVPFIHSIDFYNYLLSKNKNEIESKNVFSIGEKLKLLTYNRSNKTVSRKINGRDVIIHKKYHNTEIIIFEGGHEFFCQYAFSTFN